MFSQPTMANIRSLLLITGFSVLSTGCAITYPLVGHDYSQYSGDALTVQNRAYLIVNDALYPPYQIQAGKAQGGEQKVGEIPEGTRVEFRSFWRARRLRLLGGQIQSDYALVTVDTPKLGRVTAELPVSELENVFDGDKYHPQAAKND